MCCRRWSNISVGVMQAHSLWRWPSIKTALGHCFPVKIRRSLNVDIMLAHCLRRWPTIIATLAEWTLCICCDQTQNAESMSGWRWSTVYDVGTTSNQHWFNVLCLLGSHGWLNSKSPTANFIKSSASRKPWEPGRGGGGKLSTYQGRQVSCRVSLSSSTTHLPQGLLRT